MKIIRPTIITDAALVSSNVPEDDYPEWSSGTTYALDDMCMVTAAGGHKVYKSLQASNTGNYPPDTLTAETPAEPWWKLISATNRWKMFDGKVGAQTENADTIQVVLQCAARIDSIALLNMDAVSASIVMTDSVDGEVYNETINLISNKGINNWYDYFFEPIVRKTDIERTNLSPYSGATVTITISNNGSIARIGELVIGLKRPIGVLMEHPHTGITDYSKKKADDLGAFEVEERPYSKKLSLGVYVDNSQVDEVNRILSLFRATPLVWIATDQYSSMIAYGFCRDFDLVLKGSRRSACSIEIEGLT